MSGAMRAVWFVAGLLVGWGSGLLLFNQGPFCATVFIIVCVWAVTIVWRTGLSILYLTRR